MADPNITRIFLALHRFRFLGSMDVAQAMRVSEMPFEPGDLSGLFSTSLDVPFDLLNDILGDDASSPELPGSLPTLPTWDLHADLSVVGGEQQQPSIQQQPQQPKNVVVRGPRPPTMQVRLPASRWRRTKGKFGDLQQRVHAQMQQVELAVQENRNLRLRAHALEHAVASRDQELDILAQFKQALALGPAADREAQELLQAANMPFSIMVSSTNMLTFPSPAYHIHVRTLWAPMYLVICGYLAMYVASPCPPHHACHGPPLASSPPHHVSCPPRRHG